MNFLQKIFKSKPREAPLPKIVLRMISGTVWKFRATEEMKASIKKSVAEGYLITLRYGKHDHYINGKNVESLEVK